MLAWLQSQSGASACGAWLKSGREHLLSESKDETPTRCGLSATCTRWHPQHYRRPILAPLRPPKPPAPPRPPAPGRRGAAMNPPAPTARAPGRVPSLAVGLYVAVCLGRPALSASFAAAASAVHARTHIHTSTESAHGVRSGCSQLRRAYLQPGPWLPWLVACHVERGVPRCVSKQPWREHARGASAPQ